MFAKFKVVNCIVLSVCVYMSLCKNLKVRTKESSTYGSFHNLHFLELKFFKLHIITFYIWFCYSCIMIHAYQIVLESNVKTCPKC
jgi:hypothetical protein